MPTVTFFERDKKAIKVPAELLAGKRNLTSEEIEILKKNRNTNECDDWKNIYVSSEPGSFDPELIRLTRFEGFVVLGRIKNGSIKYHDLELPMGMTNCLLRNIVAGDDNSIVNVSYLENYRIGNRNILFNIQEMACTHHSKFGNGNISKGETEDDRKWIGISNENDGRAILPFENLITADAYLWYTNRQDKVLQKRFVELTDYGFNKNADTYGVIGNDIVIKNTTHIKDAKIGDFAYIKGAFKIKNVTILSSEDEKSQIGEGVELVNGIIGYGSRIFYQAVAVRFVIGRNCQLKYGARLLNSVLGDNSTVSCCELLNNLIYPFHEQHHNSSFLIAATVMGQSNIASGATIGSNHNSRSPDGEIIAGRGFWPGLCSDFKHNSRFASFVLASKGSYQYELDVQYPFSLIAPGESPASPIHVLPAWWFMYDMFAIVRNKYKFSSRDKRAVKVQNIEMNPFAPDTMQECLKASKKIIDLTAVNLPQLDMQATKDAQSSGNLRQAAKDYLHKNPDSKMTLCDNQVQKKYGAVIYKPVQGYKMYRKVMKYFAVSTFIEYVHANGLEQLDNAMVKKIYSFPLYINWENVGGQIIPCEKVDALFDAIKAEKINCWDEVHAYYNKCQSEYLNDKVRYAVYLLEELYSCDFSSFTKEIINDILNDVADFSNEMYEASVSCREKDYSDYYRCMTYKNKDEMEAVLGKIEGNCFLKTLKSDTKKFNEDLKKLFV